MLCCRQVTDDGLSQFCHLQKLQVLVMNNLGQGVSGSFLSRLQGLCPPMMPVLRLPFLLHSHYLLTAQLLAGQSFTVLVTLCSPSRLHMMSQAGCVP